MQIVWFIAEWLGVACALYATYILSKNVGGEDKAWKIFMLADVLHAAYYFSQGQLGLVFNQSIGFGLAILAIYIIKNKTNTEKMKIITNVMMKLFYAFSSLAVIALGNWILNPSMENIEWFAAFISLAGTTMVAANHPNSKYGFVMWMMCDVSMLIVSLIKVQLGIVLLRISYILIDINGIGKWFFKSKYEIFLRKHQIMARLLVRGTQRRMSFRFKRAF